MVATRRIIVTISTMSYPIQVVVLETGLSAHVLRVWEKRYGKCQRENCGAPPWRHRGRITRPDWMAPNRQILYRSLTSRKKVFFSLTMPGYQAEIIDI